MKINGEWKVEDWTNVGARYFCRDKASERLEELTLIYSNSQFEDRSSGSILKPQDTPPTLLASNIGCHEWTGTSKVTNVNNGVTEVVSATNFVWAPKPCSNSSSIFTMGICFTPVAGKVTWDVSGNDDLGCTYSGHDVDNGAGLVGEFMINSYTLNGSFSRAYIAGAGSEKTVTVTRVCPDGDSTLVYHDEQAIGGSLEMDWEDCPGEVCHIKDDGITISGSTDDGEKQVEWNFRAQRE
jgi:hypothetical protein